MVEIKRRINKITELSGIKFMSHDVRRTFLTIAEMLDVPHYALQKLANHKTTDITGRYIQADVERLRLPMQRITDFIMEKAGIKLQDIKRKESANSSGLYLSEKLKLSWNTPAGNDYSPS